MYNMNRKGKSNVRCLLNQIPELPHRLSKLLHLACLDEQHVALRLVHVASERRLGEEEAGEGGVVGRKGEYGVLVLGRGEGIAARRHLVEELLPYGRQLGRDVLAEHGCLALNVLACGAAGKETPIVDTVERLGDGRGKVAKQGQVGRLPVGHLYKQTPVVEFEGGGLVGDGWRSVALADAVDVLAKLGEAHVHESVVVGRVALLRLAVGNLHYAEGGEGKQQRLDKRLRELADDVAKMDVLVAGVAVAHVHLVEVHGVYEHEPLVGCNVERAYLHYKRVDGQPVLLVVNLNEAHQHGHHKLEVARLKLRFLYAAHIWQQHGQ